MNLILYDTITPNYKNNLHYYFNGSAGFTAYKTEISAYGLATLTLDNFTINNGKLNIALNDTLTIDVLRGATYALNEYDKACYYIKNLTLTTESMATFDIEVDLWGTYIGYTDITNLYVTQSNYDIGVGTYPNNDYKNYYNIDHLPYNNSKYLATSDMVVICEVSHDTQAGIGEYKKNVCTTKYYYTPVNELLSYTTSQGKAVASQYVMAWLPYVIGGICAMDNGGGFNLGAVVNKAWVLPKYLIPDAISTIGIPDAFFLSRYNLTDMNIYLWELKRPTIKTFTYSFSPSLTDSRVVGAGISDGVTVPQTTKTEDVKIITSFMQDSLKVFIANNTDIKDITDCFKVNLIATGEVRTETQEMAATIRGITNAFTGLNSSLSQIQNSNYVGALGGIYNSIANQFDYNGKVAKSNLGGDSALFLYTDPANDSGGIPANYKYYNPFIVTTYLYRDDITSKIQDIGVKYDNIYISQISTLLAKSLLNSAIIGYVACDCTIKGAPTAALDEIAGALKSGVHIKKVGL